MLNNVFKILQENVFELSEFLFLNMNLAKILVVVV